MSKDRTHQMWCSEHEKNLIEFTRKLGYGEFTLKIQDGEPITAVQPLKTERF